MSVDTALIYGNARIKLLMFNLTYINPKNLNIIMIGDILFILCIMFGLIGYMLLNWDHKLDKKQIVKK